jgi:hypothetical protein
VAAGAGTRVEAHDLVLVIEPSEES